ncbi:hypothetical protein F7725_004978 [Dissostichus mawsoni]|uniref:DOC domain-containing protein n=1 Tax=Dissostichus mawsoni TaxID=36200 RepID=A0A7J5XKC3_DISMA|nr:hypothetical protein F7725_004978 [Dissostichus mawsoni]
MIILSPPLCSSSLQQLEMRTNDPISTFMIQIAVLANHQNGRDTHMRQIKVYTPVEESSIGKFPRCTTVISKGLEKEQTMPFPNTSMVAPTKPTGTELPKIKAVSPMEKGENNCNPGQLYSKLFDEVEKVKCWKVKVDSDTLQKERRLQGNKRTIETQRKAIQELQRIILMILFALCVLSSQFGSESLSVKLEEQISENEDLRNKTWLQHLKAFVFKQKMINKRCKKKCPTAKQIAFMFSVKEALLQFEDLKEKYNQEYDMKEKEVAELQTQIRDKEHELQNLLLDLHENQKHCKQLQEATNEQCGLLSSSKTEQESLLQKRLTAEQRCTETEIKCEALAAILEQTKEEFTEMIQSKDSSLQGLRKVKNDQAETLEQIQTNIQELQDSLALETKSPHTTEAHLKTLTVRFCCSQDKTSKCVESMKEKSTSLKSNAAAGGKLFTEVKTNKEHTFQMVQLRQDIHQHEDKYTELLANFNELHCEKTVIQQQFVSRSSSVKAVEENLKVSEKKAVKLTKQIQRLEEENQGLREEVKSIENKSQEKCQETEILQKKLKQM